MNRDEAVASFMEGMQESFDESENFMVWVHPEVDYVQRVTITFQYEPRVTVSDMNEVYEFLESNA